MLSASWTSVTTCADDAVRPCARSTARLQDPDSRQLDHAPERRAPAGWRAGTPTRRRGLRAACVAGDIPPGRRAGRDHRLDDRDRLDPAAQVLTEHRPDVERRRFRGPRAPSPREGRAFCGASRSRDREAIVPPEVTVHECVRRSARAAALPSGRRSRSSPAGEPRDPGHPRSGRAAARAVARGAIAPTLGRCRAGDPRRSRREAGAGPRACGRAPGRVCEGSFRRCDARSSPVQPPGCAGPVAPLPAPACTTVGTWPASSGVLARTRRTAASCASVGAVRGLACLTTIRWAAAQCGEKDAVPSRGVDDRELLLDHLPRLDKPERQEIVGYV